MKYCKGYQLIAGSRTAWVPCVRAVEGDWEYCKKHGNALLGALLGRLVQPEAGKEAQLPMEEKAARKVERPRRRV